MLQVSKNFVPLWPENLKSKPRIYHISAMTIEIPKHKIWLGAKDYIIILIGVSMYCFGFTAFINVALPQDNRVVIGGIAGFSQVVDLFTQSALGFKTPYAVVMFGSNVILLLLAMKMVGRTFVVRTIFGVSALTGIIAFMQPMFTEPLVPNIEPMMSVIIGAVLGGIGIGMVYAHNGSTGGTDILAVMFSRKRDVSMGQMIQICDCVIIMTSIVIKSIYVEGYSFDTAVEPVFYGACVLVVLPSLADWMINQNRQAVQFTIISKHWEAIATAINNEAKRGCTILNGIGWYTKNDMKVLLVMCRRYESVTIARIIKFIDKDAFVTQCNVRGVYGQGFDQMKVKMKAPAHDDNATVKLHVPTPPGKRHKRPAADTPSTDAPAE